MTVIQAANLKWYNSTTGPNRGGAIDTGTQVSTSTLFDAVTGDETTTGKIEYRGIYFWYEDTTTGGYQSPYLWIETQTPGGDDISIALNDEGAGAKNTALETIADYFTAPTGPSFSAPANKAAGLALPTLSTTNDYMGFWIKRNVPALTGAYNSNSFTLKVEGDSGA